MLVWPVRGAASAYPGNGIAGCSSDADSVTAALRNADSWALPHPSPLLGATRGKGQALQTR